MFIFEKRTQIPVRITNKNPKLAGIILTQYGGPDGELGASLRYLSQRFTMPDNMGVGLLTDIGTSVSAAQKKNARPKAEHPYYFAVISEITCASWR